MNVKQILLGILMIGLLAGTVRAAWDTPRETIEGYSPLGKLTVPWFVPSEQGQLYLSSNNIGLHLDQHGIWGGATGKGSPQLIQSFWSNGAVVQYWFPNARILAIGPISAFTPGDLSWAKIDYAIPGVYQFDGTTSAEIDKGIIDAVTIKNPMPPKWDGEIRHDICYGTGTLSVEELGNDGKWTLQDKSDFCSPEMEKEMSKYRSRFYYP